MGEKVLQRATPRAKAYGDGEARTRSGKCIEVHRPERVRARAGRPASPQAGVPTTEPMSWPALRSWMPAVIWVTP
jgi:hypothetical protein